MADFCMQAVLKRMRFPAHPKHGGHMQQQRRENPYAFHADEHNVSKHRQKHGGGFIQRMVYAFHAVVVAVCGIQRTLMLVIELSVLGIAIAHGEVLVQHVSEVFKPQQPKFMVRSIVQIGFQCPYAACCKEEARRNENEPFDRRRRLCQLPEHKLGQRHGKHRVNRRSKRINPKACKQAFVLPPCVLHKPGECFSDWIWFFMLPPPENEMGLFNHSLPLCVKQGAVAQPLESCAFIG